MAVILWCPTKGPQGLLSGNLQYGLMLVGVVFLFEGGLEYGINVCLIAAFKMSLRVVLSVAFKMA